MALTDHANGTGQIRILSKEDGGHNSSNTLTTDEMVARKEMDEGVRWAIREKFTEPQVGTLCDLALRQPVPLAAGLSPDFFFILGFR